MKTIKLKLMNQGGYFDPLTKKELIKELEQMMLETNFWDNKRHSETVISELNNLKNSVGNLENLQSEINLSLEMCDLMDHEVEQELELSMTNIEERLKKQIGRAHV